MQESRKSERKPALSFSFPVFLNHLPFSWLPGFLIKTKWEASYFATVTAVLTEFAMKQLSCAKWCISSMSFSVG